MTPPHLDERTAFRAYVRLKSGGNIAESTLDRYAQAVFDGTKKCPGLLPWLDGEDVTEAAVAAFNEVLCKVYKPNSRVPICSGLNWYLRWKKVRDEDGEPVRFPIPQTEAAENARKITDDEYSVLERTLRKGGDVREFAAVMVQHDTGMSPGDIVATPLGLLDLNGDVPRIRFKQRKKTGVRASPYLRLETGKVLREYLAAYRPRDYLFETEPGMKFHRRWLLEVIRRACKRSGLPEDITPRTFRRTLATNWKGDIKDLQVQGGWADPKTIFKHYRLMDEERHLDGFEKTFGVRARLELPEKDDPAFR